jgi:hypothetical protein
MPERITPREASEQARAAARLRLREARETAGLSIRKLATVMNDHGHRVGFAHLARVESGHRSITRNLLVAWGAATGQADPEGWADGVVTILGQERLGRSRQILEMQFRPSQLTDVPEVLKGQDLPSRTTSPEATYARVTGLLEQAPKASPGDDQPVVVTTRGPLATAFRKAGQSIAPSGIVPDEPDARQLVQLAATQTAEDRIQVVEEMLAASATVPPNPAAASRAEEVREVRDLYEPLIAANAADFDIIVVPHIGGAAVLAHPDGGCVWLSVPADDCPQLYEYLGPALQDARSSPVIELVRAGRLMTQYWYREWETKLLEHEQDAEERLYLQPHLGLHTLPPKLATERGRLEIDIGGQRLMERDTGSWLSLRAERIAVFRRKLMRDGCRYRDIASYETVKAMAADGYNHIRGIPLPTQDDPKAKFKRLAWVREQLSSIRDLMNSYPDNYELRFVPAQRIPANRQWSLVRKPSQQADVLLTFTLTDQAPSPARAKPQEGQGPWFANAVVRDQEVSKRFREEFEQLWAQAPDRAHTLQVLQESIVKINATVE